MEPPQLMKIAMPHREIDARSCLNFFGSLASDLGFEKSRGGDLTLRTIMLASICEQRRYILFSISHACSIKIR